MHIEQDAGRACGFARPRAAPRRPQSRSPDSPGRQHHRQDLANGGIVVDDEYLTAGDWIFGHVPLSIDSKKTREFRTPCRSHPYLYGSRLNAQVASATLKRNEGDLHAERNRRERFGPIGDPERQLSIRRLGPRFPDRARAGEHKVVESAIARNRRRRQELGANVVVLDDVTPRYLNATAALHACNGGLGVALHRLLDVEGPKRGIDDPAACDIRSARSLGRR